MGFKFSYVCDLLSSLDNNRIAKTTSEARKKDPDVSTVSQWFDNYERKIHSGDTDRLALLSCIFPEKRPERVFRLREPSLTKVVGRCLLLGASRKQELDRWREKGWGDLGQCVEYVMQQAENCLEGQDEVTVEEIDLALAKVASRCRFSGPTARYQYSAVGVDETLSPIFRRLSSRDAKWFTRLILKDFNPVTIPTQLILRHFHFLLPKLLFFQNSLEGALMFLAKEPINSFPPRPEAHYADLLSKLALPHLRPEVGFKIGRADFLKARSLKHCCKMADRRIMGVEKKYDGEYCQIHIDLSKADSMRIFSKSGKDSTRDRRGVHNTLRKSLRIGKDDCRFSIRCIVECEILVWSDRDSSILPFHKLRKHIARSGSFIGIDNDSQPDASEHLYLAFFDVLMVDDDVCLSKPYRQRRQILQDIVDPIEGYSELAQQQTINFSHPDSYQLLRDAVAMAAALRWEGLVLKGSDEPYFPLFEENADVNFGRWIKLKKEYIPGLGDSVDFALIGARYDAQDALQCPNVKNLSWTSFFVGCQEGDNQNLSVKARNYRVIDVLGRHNISPKLMQTLNQLGQFQACEQGSEPCPFSIRIDQPQIPEMEVFFRIPFVVELVGSGFERPHCARYFTLRFPRVLKIHSDRGLDDAVSFEELQQLAEAARAVPVEQLSQEIAIWTAKLDAKDGKLGYIVDDSEMFSASSDSPDRMSSETWSFATMSLNESFIDNRNHIDIPSYKLVSAPVPPVQRHDPNFPAIRTMNSHSPKIEIHKTSTNSLPSINILPDDTQSTSAVEDSFRSTNASSGFLTDLKASSRKTNRHKSPGENIPSDPVTIPTSPLSPNELTNLENKPRVLKGKISEQPTKTQSWNTFAQSHCVLSKKARQGSPHAAFQEDSIRVSVEGNGLLHKAPMFLSPGISKKARDLVDVCLKKLNRSSTLSILHFFDEISSMKNLRISSKSASLPSRYGIVIVDPKNGDASDVASDIQTIGNGLAKCRRQGRLLGSGKILFVHWKILHLAVSRRTRSQRNWDSYGKAIFAGCLKWGYGVPTRQRHMHNASLESRQQQQSKRPQAETDVVVSMDWKEILPLMWVDHG
ncbi:ATP dependent DNA ligase domain containing protein [Coccidioides posadasii C735 delta SOWgp]|uniref:ATP dependent DNA ligase domain containing protein n=1 Tax=Coccidioides posadasii (strain C735) TaxID=222929 RepID=C5P4G8_COCP7|nr:ATP dependent DNA ligase domain containing protein [Coccidioides posadasii C735 delta SOWgp]EER27608.1 ATP dependent DNA ligase domain containing protein [Coccidioides posadasii C735 delta SOWgp]|eukprot:XP_003069753.1 ATP dependent DNA ligase domain containing protein [Coccidioides posadasii C735 delta SOWgp]